MGAKGKTFKTQVAVLNSRGGGGGPPSVPPKKSWSKTFRANRRKAEWKSDSIQSIRLSLQYKLCKSRVHSKLEFPIDFQCCSLRQWWIGIGWDMLSWASETYAVFQRIWRGEWLMSSSWQVFKERQDMSTISIHTRFRHQEKIRDSFRILNFSARQRQQIKTFPNQVWSIHATGDGPICSNTVFTREWQDFWLLVGLS